MLGVARGLDKATKIRGGGEERERKKNFRSLNVRDLVI